VSKLAVFLIRLATDPEVRDLFRNPDTRDALLKLFKKKNALSAADIDALNNSSVSGVLNAISASNQQTDGTAIRVKGGGQPAPRRTKTAKPKKK